MVSRILKLIDAVPKFGNDIPEVDAFARDVAYTYTKPLEKYKNPRGGIFQAGLISSFGECTAWRDRQEPRRTDVWHICR